MQPMTSGRRPGRDLQSWRPRPALLLSASGAIVVMVLLAGYGLWTTSGGVALEEVVVTVMPHTPTPPPVELQPAEVAAARDPEAAAEADVEPLGSSYTVIPDLLLRDEPTVGGVAYRQLEVATPVELLGEEAEADGFEWVHARLEDGTLGWLIAAGVAEASSE